MDDAEDLIQIAYTRVFDNHRIDIGFEAFGVAFIEPFAIA